MSLMDERIEAVRRAEEALSISAHHEIAESTSYLREALAALDQTVQDAYQWLSQNFQEGVPQWDQDATWLTGLARYQAGWNALHEDLGEFAEGEPEGQRAEA